MWEFRELRRDRRTVAMMIVLPVVLLVELLSRAGVGAAVEIVPASLEEAFVDIVSAPTSRATAGDTA